VESRTLGKDLDARGVTVTLGEGDLISDVVLLAEVLRADGSRGFCISTGPHANPLKTLGMVTKAKRELEFSDV
jgi:hypothetical protein